jgi:hypothetical protein
MIQILVDMTLEITETGKKESTPEFIEISKLSIL